MMLLLVAESIFSKYEVMLAPVHRKTHMHGVPQSESFADQSQDDARIWMV